MVGLIILGVIIAIIVAIMLVPVGADVAYEGGELRLSAKVCGVLAFKAELTADFIKALNLLGSKFFRAAQLA